MKINIAGQIFRTFEDTINRMPDTVLGNPERRKEYYDPENNEYFFDRHRESFPAILYFYQSDGIMGKFGSNCPDNFYLQIPYGQNRETHF